MKKASAPEVEVVLRALIFYSLFIFSRRFNLARLNFFSNQATQGIYLDSLKFVVIGFNQPLIQFIFLIDKSLDHLAHFASALLLVPLHLAESAFVLAEHLPDLVLAGAHPLDIGDDRVADHLRILPEPQRAERLLQLPRRRRHAQHDRRPRVAPQRRPQDLRQRRVTVGDVRVLRGYYCC